MPCITKPFSTSNKMIVIKKRLFTLTLFTFLTFLSCQKPIKNTIDMYSIVPYPETLDIKYGRFNLNKDTKFVILNNTSKLENSSAIFRNLLQQQLGFNLEIETKLKPNKNYISLETSSNLSSEESYNLSISNNSIHLLGGSEKGVFNGLQSLRQLLKIDTYKGNSELEIPNVQIKDSPRYSWRGVMVDESRHFFGK